MKKLDPNFYAVIIGTEILSGRREDRHFDFLRQALAKKGHRLKGSFVIEDDPELMERVYRMIAQDPQAVLFSFGGIGATPDDYTRAVAAKVFGDGRLYEHPQAKKLIEERFGQEAYPHRIQMAYLPKDAELLPNPVNKVPGFSLLGRFFFVPGFPQMAHPMIEKALEQFPDKALHRQTICVKASENDLMDLMQAIPSTVEFSSLPGFGKDGYYDVLSIAAQDPQEVEKWMEFLKKGIEERGFAYKEGETC